MSETEPDPEDEEQDYSTPEEARAAIEGLGEADRARLVLIARSLARSRLRGTVIEAEDLLHEAILKTLDGRRRWPKSIQLIKHLDRVMESDAGHLAAQRVAHVVVPLPTAKAFEPAALAPSPEERLSVAEDLDHLQDLFAADPPALSLLRLKGQGFQASAIQRQLGIGATEYNTITKRIRRRLIQHLSNGEP